MAIENRGGRAQIFSSRLRGALEKLGPGGSTFVIGMAVVNLSNFIFHFVVSRLLGPGGYGELGSFLNLLLVLSVGVGAVQVAFTQSAAALDGNASRFSLAGSLIKTSLFGVVGAAALLLVHTQIERFLHVQSVSLVLELGIWIPLSLVGSVLQGVLMGKMRFGVVALALVIGTGLGRIVFGVLFVKLGFGAAGALGGSIVGQAITLVILFVPLRSNSFSHSAAALNAHLGDGLRSVLALSGFWLLASEDTILARHFLSAHDSGLYASGATAGRIAMFLPGAIALIAFPRFAARSSALGKSGMRGSRKSMCAAEISRVKVNRAVDVSMMRANVTAELCSNSTEKKARSAAPQGAKDQIDRLASW